MVREYLIDQLNDLGLNPQLGLFSFGDGFPLAGVAFTVALLCFLLGPFITALAPSPSARHRACDSSGFKRSVGSVGSYSVAIQPGVPTPDTIVYSLNADNHHAIWITYDDSADDWTQQFITEHPRRGNMPEYHAVSPDDLWNSAPTIDLPGPEVELLQRSDENGVRSLHLRLRSPRHANSVSLNLGPSTEFVAATIAGRDPFQDRLRGKPGVPRQIGIIPFIGVPDEGVEVTLKLKCAGQCNIGASDRSFGLPNLPGFSFRPRPKDKMGWYGSDVTLVGRQYRF